MLAAARFGRLLGELALTDAERTAGMRAFRAVRSTLLAHYYGHLSLHDHSRLIGAWAKRTDVRPSPPVDMLFVLPKGLRQPAVGLNPEIGQPRALMEAARHMLGAAHGAAAFTAGGSAILVTCEAQDVMVRLAFPDAGGRFLLCDAKGGGGFRASDPALEEANLKKLDASSHGNACDLIRMLKCWQNFRRVPLTSFAIELMAIEFLGQWARAGDPVHFYDWMIRDFFAFLLAQAGRAIPIPGTDDTIVLGAEWLSAATEAQTHAAKACDFETGDLNADAWWEWEKIFGERVPLDDR